MKSIARYTIAILVFLMSGSAAAQFDDAGVRNIFFDTIRAGDVQPITVGVDDMRYTGVFGVSAQDSTYMRWVTDMVRWDVDFYADFDLIPIDSFYLRTYEITELDLLAWSRLGADYTVRLECEFQGPRMLITWRIFQTMGRNEIGSGKLSDNRTFWRQLAHSIADDIVRSLTGDRGIFRTKIVYSRQLSPTNKELFVSDFDGANERQLTDNGSINISPAFAPNSPEVYFTSYLDGDPNLYRINIQTGRQSKVASYPGIVAAPAISPDGKRIACVLTIDGNSEIYLIDLNGSVIQRLTRTRRAIESSPTWSPDGEQIAFVSDRTGSPQIYIMNDDGLDARRLTFEGGYNDSPVWSLRGDRITFVSRTRSGRFDLASINTDGTDYRVLTQVGQNENPHFAPDGKHIIFRSTRLSGGDIYTMDVTGRNQRRITRTGDAGSPTWGPYPD